MTDEAVAEAVEDAPELVEVEAETEEVADEVVESEETGEEQGEPEPEESSPSKKESEMVQKRIDELTKRYYDEKRAREALEAQMNAKPVQPGKTLEDFEYDESAYASYLQEEARQSAEANVRQNLERERQLSRQAEFEGREASFAAKTDDYHTVTRNPQLAITQHMVETVQNAEKGPEVLYYLGKHPDIAMSLANMSPLDAAREIGRIEATELVAPDPPKTDVPKPPPKIQARGNAEKIEPNVAASDKLSDSEWLKRRNKQLARK